MQAHATHTTWSKNGDALYACNRRVNAMVAVPTQSRAKRPASIKSRVDTGSVTFSSVRAGSDTGVGCVSCSAKSNENEGHKRQQKSPTRESTRGNIRSAEQEQNANGPEVGGRDAVVTYLNPACQPGRGCRRVAGLAHLRFLPGTLCKLGGEQRPRYINF